MLMSILHFSYIIFWLARLLVNLHVFCHFSDGFSLENVFLGICCRFVVCVRLMDVCVKDFMYSDM